MARISEAGKQARLERLKAVLQQHPDGLSEREIADLLSFERRTTHNYLHELDMLGLAYKEGQFWHPLPHQSGTVRRLELPPEEAMILYLAARLFVKQSDQRNEAAETALVKLADILSSDLGLNEDLYEVARELAQRPKSPAYEDVFRTVMRGYIYRRWLRILYHPYRGEPFETLFAPYLLEPSAIGFATYAIGHSSLVDGLRTYKIERIEQAHLLMHDEYEIPTDFSGLELLRNAWSIYYGDEVVHVVLRFHPEVVRRVKETYWHPSQQIETDGEYLIVAFDVADTTDLKPWIRTWGANCEVIEPAVLREEMMGEARRLAHLYGWSTTMTHGPDHSRFGDIFGGRNTR